MRSNWPIKLYWLPYGLAPVSVSLGPVSSSFLLNKRLRRRGEGGCFLAIDVNPQSPGGGPLKKATGCSPPVNCGSSGKADLRYTKENVSPNNLQGCKKESRNGRVARAAVRLLEQDQKIKRVRPLPPRISCGSLRHAVRQVFPPDLTVVQELSVKTAQKLIKPCDLCEQEACSALMAKYMKERFEPDSPVDVAHVQRFKRAMAVNIPSGWNKKKSPYIPTGHATLFNKRRQGGSWNREPFSRFARAECVFSSGKPRIVTMYSSRNSELLSPLHDALYAAIRKGWLLVGSPTDELVQGLNGSGPYVSVDYRSATDNIRAVYVRASIEVLKEKSECLSDEEAAALDVLAELRFASGDFVPGLTRAECLDGSEPATRGQPMGSLISFPLLCLINKSVVDLALADLLDSGKIRWKEFQRHRCLINGDDLLYREFTDSRDILDGILRHGGMVGLVVNTEKTMVSPEIAEINSTSFRNGRKEKKTNVNVLEFSKEVTDPIGFLADSVVRPSSFRRLLELWKGPIRDAERKIQGPIPRSFFASLYRSRAVKESLVWFPTGRKESYNPFPIAARPDGYDLTRGEEIGSIHARVSGLMDSGYRPEKPVRSRALSGEVRSIQSALRRIKPREEDNILKVLADTWYWKTKEKSVKEDDVYFLSKEVPAWCQECYEGSHSKIQCIAGIIRTFKQREKGQLAAELRQEVLAEDASAEYIALT
ncbi:RNA-dependent RNA polymerase [Phomopsis longicolla RNA virus 1]|uniref:RNA-dependent RNA polymerase n=1 Tax=Phomopsis longicolla RNA virus 1 TaxID=1779340 RepID=A0A1P7ZJ82_9VIRU|nr:RNA-dependent RNA polymerase [Phomopsis longicolla RNA virus 1]AMB21743.1 RNA-dependent RNA polymerase [Phomopsis longicolla RNA virus 1]